MDPGADVTGALRRWRDGEDGALDTLMAAVYPELRRIAARQLRAERADHTLQPTALVHEVFLRLIDQERVSWENRAHFLAIAARLTRRVLVDHARRRQAAKRGHGARPMRVDDVRVSAGAGPRTDLIALDEALDRLAALDSRQARVVELRYFGGLSIEEVAVLLEVSTGTVKRDWESARLWLFDVLRSSGSTR